MEKIVDDSKNLNSMFIALVKYCYMVIKFHFVQKNHEIPDLLSFFLMYESNGRWVFNSKNTSSCSKNNKRTPSLVLCPSPMVNSTHYHQIQSADTPRL